MDFIRLDVSVRDARLGIALQYYYEVDDLGTVHRMVEIHEHNRRVYKSLENINPSPRRRPPYSLISGTLTTEIAMGLNNKIAQKENGRRPYTVISKADFEALWAQGQV